MPHRLSISTRAPKKFDKEKTKEETAKILEKIAEKQKVLYAQSKYSLLIILQGVDASGKDGVIAHVFSGVNPLGCNVYPFKVPTPDENAHDFLWRVHKQTPARGMIHIFNRSHYESVLVPFVNKDSDEKTLKHRMDDINHFEKLLEHNNTVVLKFYLHISRDEQHQRLLERETNPEKFWKHNDEDWHVRRKWKKYMEAYELIFENCNDPEWVIVPSDQNWYKEYIVSKTVLEALERLDLEYPKLVTKMKNLPKPKKES